jgi:hypothetical protein
MSCSPVERITIYLTGLLFLDMDFHLHLPTIQSVLSAHAKIVEYLDFEGCLKFIELIQLLKPAISLSPALNETAPPDRLPLNVHTFLMKCLGLKHEITKIVWLALSPIAWNLEVQDVHVSGQRHLQLFLDHGISLGIGKYSS